MSTVVIISLVLSWLVIAALTAVVLSLMRQVGALHLQLGTGPLPTGPARLDLYDEPEAAVLPLLGGGTMTLGGVRGRPVVTFAYAPGCSSCEGAEEQLGTLAAQDPGVDVLAVVGLPRDEARAHVDSGALPAGVAAVALEDLPAAWDPPATPWMVALAADGAVAAVGRPRTTEQLLEAAYAAREAVMSAGPGSERSHDWGDSVPYWDAGALTVHHVGEDHHGRA